MQILRKEKKFCYACMKEHDVSIVRMDSNLTFLGEAVQYQEIHEYCEETDCLTTTSEMISNNDIAMKDAYRRQKGLMTSGEIKELRNQYQISQTELAALLGWGAKTITRYETYQVQDMAHDNILKRLQQDPQWFMELLENRQANMTERRYLKYFNAARKRCSLRMNQYTEKMIRNLYIGDSICKQNMGNTDLSVEKIEETMNYMASKDVASLYLLKMVKLLWYADYLHYKRNRQSITGLAYRVQKLGVVPIGYEYLTTLSHVHCEEQEMGDGIGHLFLAVEKFVPKHLTKQELECIDEVLERFGNRTCQEMSKTMEREVAVVNTPLDEIMSYDEAKNLSIA